MEVMPRVRSLRWCLWAVSILLVIAVNVWFLGYQHGECIDYAIGSGAKSTCSSGPVLGIGGTCILAIVSVAAIAYFTRRLVHAGRAGRHYAANGTGQ